MESGFPLPLVINFSHLQIDSFIAFILGMLFAVTLNAEAQAFTATILGDRRAGTKDRFHFNPFLHLDILGTVAFLVGGIGWPRPVHIDASKFKRPRLYTLVTRFAGPLANLFLAGIGGSIIILIQIIHSHPGLFPGVIAVSIAVAVYNLIPIPPLAAGNLWLILIPDKFVALKRGIHYAGAVLLIALLALDRSMNHELLGPIFHPLVSAVFTFCLGQI